MKSKCNLKMIWTCILVYLTLGKNINKAFFLRIIIITILLEYPPEFKKKNKCEKTRDPSNLIMYVEYSSSIPGRKSGEV